MTTPDWIWIDEPVTSHRFARFRTEFRTESAQTLTLRIAADTDFTLWLDGVEVARGQYPAYPWKIHYTELRQPVSSGRHAIAIRGYYCGGDSFQTTFASWIPGVWLEALGADGTPVVTDSCRRSWKMILTERF